MSEILSRISRVQRSRDGRVEYLTFTYDRRTVRACRYWQSNTRTCPWLIAMGADVLPLNAVKRGILLTMLYKS